jgi:phosphatidylinositol alpha-mannosyltransferase
MTRRRGPALRIGLVCPYSFEVPGGVQNHVLGLARQLLEEGHEPYVLAPGTLGGMPPGTVESERFTSAGTAVAVRYNGSVARVNFGPLSAARVARWLRAGRFDLLHLHEPITPSISLLALWAAELPVVATCHTATPRSRSMQIAGGVLRSAIEKIDAGIAVSESARDVVVRHLGRDAVVIPNGIRCAEFGATAAAAQPSSGRRMLFLGRVDEPRKGLDVLVAAAGAIRQAVPDLEIVVAGQGTRPLPLGLVDAGIVTDNEKAALLAHAHCFVAPHRARESFGIVVLEAMASGTPVLASDIDAFSDLLRAGRDRRILGELFTEGDPAALAAGAIRLLNHTDPVRTAAAQRAAQHYDWSRVGGRILAVYAAAMEAAEAVRLAGAAS